MRMSVNLKINSLINQKAQAMLELATFGSLLLFCLALLVHFGLSMNYQQNAQMQAFRKGLKIAYYKQGPGSQASFVMVKDKPVVDPRDKWGFGDRVPVGGGASISWDPNLSGMYVADSEAEPDVRDLPRMYIEMDKSMRLDDSEINDNIDNIGINDKEAAQDKGIFTTANFAQMALGPEQTLRIYVPDSKNEHGGSYYYIDIKARQVKVLEDADDPKQNYAVYLGADGLIRRLSSVDLTEDGKIDQVGIIAVRGDRPGGCDPESRECGQLTWIRYIDPTIGDINTEYTQVEPGYAGKTLEKQQGLLTNNTRKNDYGAGTKIIVRDEGKEFYTETQSTATQTITHKIGFQKAGPGPGAPMVRDVRDVTVEFKQPAQSYNWKVAHE